MSLILYGTELSPPVRAVLLTLRALNLEYEFRQLNILAGEHLEPELLRKNPLHTVPMLEDTSSPDLFICDSHAIIAYLVNKYAAEDALYPKDAVQRAIVDQRVHYENGVLFHCCFKPLQILLFREHVTELPKQKIEHVHEAYELLEHYLGENAYMAGAQLTIADFSIVSTVSTLHLCYAPVNGAKYVKLAAWMARMSALPYYEEANLRGARALTELVRAKLPKQFDKLWQKAFEDIKSGAGKD